MSFAPMAEIRCSFPDETGHCSNAVGGYGTAADVRAHARLDLGWQTGAPGGLDFCPEHRKTTPKGATPVIVFITVSNDDGSPNDPDLWKSYTEGIRDAISDQAVSIIGDWRSAAGFPAARSACWQAEVFDDDVPLLKAELGDVVAGFGLAPVVWFEAPRFGHIIAQPEPKVAGE